MIPHRHIFLLSTENPNINTGGKNTHINLLKKGLDKRQIKNTLICPDSSFYNISKYHSAFLFFKYFDFRILFSPHICHFFSLFDHIFAKISEINPNEPYIFHCHDVITMHLISKIRHHPDDLRILTVHGYYSKEILDDNRFNSLHEGKKIQLFCEKIEHEAYSVSHKIIAVDSRIKDYLMYQYKCHSDKVHVLHNATDIDEFHPINQKEKIEIRKKFGYNFDDWIILVPRRLVPKNGVEYAIKAIKKMTNKSLRLIIAGDGLLYKSLKLLSDNDLRIIFLGDVSHSSLIKYYHISDIVLIPSITSEGIQEATTLSMLEGMACGRAVICSNIGGMKEVSEMSGAIITVEEANSDAIALAIENLIKSGNTNKLGNKARNYVELNHSYLTYTDKILSIYFN